MSAIWTLLRQGLFACLLGLAACASGPSGQMDTPRETKPLAQAARGSAAKASLGDAKAAPGFRVALLLPLSGNYRDVGQALLNAATLALFDQGDPGIEILPFDTKGTPEGAAAATEAALGKNVQLILGPLLAPSIRAAAPIAAKKKVKIVGFSSDRTVAGNGVYLLSFLPDEEVRRIVSFAHARGREKFATMIPQTPYGDTVIKSFSAILTQTGGVLAASETYQPTISKIYTPVRNLAHYDARKQELQRERAFLQSFGKDDFAQDILATLARRETLGGVKFDAVLLPEGAGTLKAMAPLFAYYEVDMNRVKLLGTGLWNDRSLLNEPQLKGGWFAAPDPTRSEAFFDRYNGLYKKSAPRISTLAYDAVALATTLSHDWGKPEQADRLLTNRNGFSGIDGIFRFRPDGTAERGLAVLEIQPAGFKIVSPAPKNFKGFEELMSGRKLAGDQAMSPK